MPAVPAHQDQPPMVGTIQQETPDEVQMGALEGNVACGSQAALSDLPSGSQIPLGNLPSGSQIPPSDLPSGSKCPPGDLPSGSKSPTGDLPSENQSPLLDLPSGSQSPLLYLPSGSQSPLGELPSPRGCAGPWVGAVGADTAPQVMGRDKKPSAVSRVIGSGSVVAGPKQLVC